MNPSIKRSSHQRCSTEKGVLRNLTKLTGKHLCQSLCHRCFLVNFAKFLRAPLDDCFCIKQNEKLNKCFGNFWSGIFPKTNATIVAQRSYKFLVRIFSKNDNGQHETFPVSFEKFFKTAFLFRGSQTRVINGF